MIGTLRQGIECEDLCTIIERVFEQCQYVTPGCPIGIGYCKQLQMVGSYGLTSWAVAASKKSLGKKVSGWSAVAGDNQELSRLKGGPSPLPYRMKETFGTNHVFLPLWRNNGMLIG